MSIKMFRECADNGDVLGSLIAMQNIEDLNSVYVELYGDTPLIYAVNRDVSSTVVSALIEAGAEVNGQNTLNYTPLHFASSTGTYDLVKILLEHKACTDLENDYGKTALHYASEEGRRDVITLLLEYGADIEIVDKNGWTPLHIAHKLGHKDVAEVLLQCEAKKQP